MQPRKRDHEHTGFSWYLSEKPNIFNPYNLSDRISRKTWYENITYPDMINSNTLVKTVKKVNIREKHTHQGPNALFTILGCPECYKNNK